MYCVFLENSEQQYISLIKGENMKKQNMFTKEYAWRGLMTAGGLLVIAITICIGAFLIYKGSGTFTIFGHSIFEFLGSTDWNPEDNAQGGGTVGALIFIVGSLCTCGLALLIATPFAVGSAIFMIEIPSPKPYPSAEVFAGRSRRRGPPSSYAFRERLLHNRSPEGRRGSIRESFVSVFLL